MTTSGCNIGPNCNRRHREELCNSSQAIQSRVTRLQINAERAATKRRRQVGNYGEGNLNTHHLNIFKTFTAYGNTIKHKATSIIGSLFSKRQNQSAYRITHKHTINCFNETMCKKLTTHLSNWKKSNRNDEPCLKPNANEVSPNTYDADTDAQQVEHEHHDDDAGADADYNNADGPDEHDDADSGSEEVSNPYVKIRNALKHIIRNNLIKGGNPNPIIPNTSPPIWVTI